jgi:uncharacterized repeat protein (TIGR01451 family)
MKATTSNRILTAILIGMIIAVAVPTAVWAAGTIAGTSITNSVSVGYSIGGVPGTAVVATATFRVGVRVSMTVTRQNANFVDAAAGGANSYLTFLVTNTTNTALDFGLVSQVSTTNPFDGATNSFVTVPSVTAYVDVNNDGVYDAGDTAVFRNIAPDANVRVFIVGNMPAGELNGRVQAFSLTAVARAAGSGAGATTDLIEGVGTYNGVDVVFGDAANGLVAGDAARDARASDRSAFRISGITVTKTSAVYSDPINGAVAGARPIPGAIVTYTIVISNPGAAASTNISVTDNLSGFIPSSAAFVTQFNDGTTSCALGRGIIIDGACYTNANDAETPSAQYTAGNVVNITGHALASGATSTIRYQVQINP